MAFLGGPLLSGKRSLGASLGADLGSALKGLAEHKVQQKHDNEKAKLWTSQGVDAETARALVHAPESLQKAFFERWDAPQQQQQQQPVMAQAPEQPMQSSYSPEEVNLLKSIGNPYERNKVAQMMQQQRQGAQPVDSTEPSRQFGQAAAQQQVAEKLAQPKVGGLKPANYKALEKLDQDKTLADYKSQLTEEREERKLEHEGVKESKKWLIDSNKKEQADKRTIAEMKRMEKLVHSGKLDGPVFAAGLDTLSHGLWGVGINLKSLLSPESVEFQKISTGMLRGLKDVFGGRVTNIEVENFLQTLPTLTQTDEGKLAVIENIKLFAEASAAQNKVAKEVIRENGNKVPADLELQVQEKLEPYLDEVYDRFVNQTHTKPKEKPLSERFGPILKTGLQAFGL